MKLFVKLVVSCSVSILVMWPIFMAQPQLRPVLEDPKHVFFDQSGDAWKNIYTVAYHTVHDECLIETQAFNYPDGEHIAFADGQPLLTWVLKLAHVESAENVYRVVQLLPFWGCILGAVLLTWLLLRLHMPVVYAILFGIGIALLSPQMPRASVHFGLSYVFALPIVLHLLLSWVEQRSWKIIALMAVALVLLGQLHLYMLAEGLLLAGLFMMLTQLLHWKGSGLKVLAQLLTLGLSSFIISKGLVDLLWFVEDRPAAPYGLKAFTTSWEELIIDRSLPWWHWFNEHISKIRKPGGFESTGYLGIVSGVFVIYLLFRYVLARLLIRPWLKREPRLSFSEFWIGHNQEVITVMSLLFGFSFLISSGYLLAIPGFEEVLDKLGAVRQFRSLGRFNWVGYYPIQVATALVLTFYCLAKAKRVRNKDSVLLIGLWKFIPFLAAGLLIWEGERSLSKIPGNPRKHSYQLENWAASIEDSMDYQAILPLPYFHEGSENYSALSRHGQAGPSTLLSIATGLPNMGVKMSRQSGVQTRERLGLNMPWIEIPKVLKKLDQFRPIIILVQRLAVRENKKAGSAHDFRSWFQETDTLYVDDDVYILSFYPTDNNLEKVLHNYCSDWTFGAGRTAFSNGVTYTNTFSERGWGLNLEDAITLTSTSFQEIDHWPRYGKNSKYRDQDLMVRWMTYIGEDGYAGNSFELRLSDTAGGETTVLASPSALLDTKFYMGDWAQLSAEVPKDAKGNQLSLWGKVVRHPNVNSLPVRNLVVEPKDSAFVLTADFGLMRNGLLLRSCD